MIITKTFRYNSAEIKITADTTSEGTIIENIIATIFHDDGTPKYFSEDIGSAFLEIPGIQHFIEKMDWQAEIEQSEDCLRDDLHDQLFGQEVDIYEMHSERI